MLSEIDKFDGDGFAVNIDVPKQSYLKYKEFLRGFRVKSDAYAKTCRPYEALWLFHRPTQYHGGRGKSRALFLAAYSCCRPDCTLDR